MTKQRIFAFTEMAPPSEGSVKYIMAFEGPEIRMRDRDDRVVSLELPPSAALELAQALLTTPGLIKHMVDRFLAWKLPGNFSPDAGISFKHAFNEHSPYGPMRHEPEGTNLFDAQQVEAMVRYMVEGMCA